MPFGSNVLENPGFEAGNASGWFETGDISGSIGAPSAGAQSGRLSVELTIAGGGAVPEVRQTFPASPGEVYEMSGFMLTEGGLPAGPSFGLYKIVFQDECGTDLFVSDIETGGQNVDFPGVESTPFLDAGAPAGTWVESVARGTAPAGTVQVVFLALNVDFAGGENPIWFDNISASVDDGASPLANTDFEDGLTDWAAGGGGPTISAPGVGANDGNFAALLKAPNAVSFIEQVFPTAPGDEVSISGFLLTEAAIPAGPSFGLLKIEFRDAMGGPLEADTITTGVASAPDNPGIDSQPFLDAASSVDTWVFTEAAGTAPAGAVEVAFLALNVDFAGGSNPIWVDTVMATTSAEDCILGDVDGNGVVNLLDVGPFVALLSGGGSTVCEADINEDGSVNLLDVGPFVEILSGG